MNEECTHYITSTIIENPYKVPMKIVSGDIKYLNNKYIPPNTSLELEFEVPVGFIEYTKVFMGLNQRPCMMVGWIVDEAGDLLY